MRASEARAAAHRARREARAKSRKIKENLQDDEWWKTAATVAVVIVGYFISSMGLTFYQKRLISVRRISIAQCSFYSSTT